MKRSCWIIFVAVALVLRVEQVYINGNHITGMPQVDVTVVYAGDDVPGQYDIAHLSVQVSSNTTLVNMASGLAAVVRSEATSRGYSVGANKVFEPAFTAN